MLFAATILVAVGYTLVYAGVKGQGYQIGGKPVWRQPWLPFVAVFTGHLGAGTVTDANTSGYVATDPSGGSSPAPSSPGSPGSPAPSSPAFAPFPVVPTPTVTQPPLPGPVQTGHAR